MLGIDFNKAETIGLQYVFDMLAPCSAYGRKRIKALRPFAPGQEELLERELDNVDRLVNGKKYALEECVKMERVFMQVKDLEKAIDSCGQFELGEVDLFEIKRFLLQCEEIFDLYIQVEEILALEEVFFLDTQDALDILDPERSRIATFHISNRYSENLTKIRREKKEIEERIRLEKSFDIKENLHQLRREIAIAEDEEERKIRRILGDKLVPFKEAMLHNCDTIGRLDLLLQKAKIAVKYGGSRPKISENELVFEEMTNPMVVDQLVNDGGSFTPISIKLGVGATVITGANMGGKSVALKTIALNALLGGAGFFPFASEATVCLFDGIHLVSEDLEDSKRGLSSFGGEIVSLMEVLESTKSRFSLVLMDEFARGTNPHEGAAIAGGAIEYFNKINSISVFTTHYDGVASKGGAHYQVVGLGQIDFKKLKAQLAGVKGADGVKLIGKYMNYGLFKVEGNHKMPRDGVNICRLLGLDSSVLNLIESRLK